MMNHKKSANNTGNYPYCRQPWHIGALLVGCGFVFTVVWAFHLLDDLDDRLAFLRFTALQESLGQQNAGGHSPGYGSDQSRGQSSQSSGQRSGQMGGQSAQSPMVPAAFKQNRLASAPGTAPAEMRIRAALVNIAGMRKVNGVGPAQFVTAGSGVLVTSNGYVATAAHVTAGLKEILVRVQTPSGPRQYVARVVKTDPTHDIAILKLVSRDIFPYLPLAPETQVLKPGDAVVAWGDPSGTNALVNRGQVNQVEVATTVGGYRLTHLLQTGAVSHWSQSGGPLVDKQGRVVGINVVAQSAMGVVGYAVPSDVLLAHFQDVVSFPRVAPVARAATNGPIMAHQQGQMTTPVVQGQGMATKREARPADAWWAQAQAVYGTPSTNSAQSGLGVYAAATRPTMPMMNTVPQAQVVPVVHNTEQRYWGYSVNTLLGLLSLGLISGISGGMMTMGGGIIKVTGLLLFFGYGMLLIRPVAYITNIFLYGAAVLRYRHYKLIMWDSVRGLIPWAMAGVVLGYFIGNVMGTLFIHYLLGVFAALVGIRMLVEIVAGRQTGSKVVEEFDPEQTPAQAKQEQAKQAQAKPTATFLRYLGIGQVSEGKQKGSAEAGGGRMARDGVLGLPMGIVSGILGITGGVVEVPLQRYVAGVPLRNAIANSAVLVFCASSVGSIVAMTHGIQTGAFDWSAPIKLAVILIPGAYVGGWIGAWLTKIVPIGMLRWLYAGLMFVIAGRMFIS